MKAKETAPDESRCLFCFPSALRAQQLLLAGPHLYACAARGQPAPHSIMLATHTCRQNDRRLSCCIDLTDNSLDEALVLAAIIQQFHISLGLPSSIYEHGRGNGVYPTYPGEPYVFHPHLWVVPLELDAINERLSAERIYGPASWPNHQERCRIAERETPYVLTGQLTQGLGQWTTRPTVEIYALARSSQFSVRHVLKNRRAKESSDWRDPSSLERAAETASLFDSWYADALVRDQLDGSLQGSGEEKVKNLRRTL